MCDKDSIDDVNQYAQRTGELTRRRFGAWSLASSLTMLLPAVAGAADVTESEVEIRARMVSRMRTSCTHPAAPTQGC